MDVRPTRSPTSFIASRFFAPRAWKEREAASSAYHDFADLDDRGLVGIVWNVCHDLLGMRPKTSLECLDRVAEDVTHSDIRRRSAGCSTRKALVNSVGLASITHASF